ncbi:uncharacterized protein MELLADRAFT_106235 [Melampsora larici-populina 98AG31]|uniref:Uncharacterized protein n=1 Tax=Melampsora larici-populina (strain 98AG31 / pathotype 3-4-7) TaxID=747676 RepID=F4RKQ9_MELLP|nr:uncharacterized protein MELLADRAFT_106235 [Melampsora larici-populina 98AG31]EGG06996.1 hypothetical protein MELLADRAFT_106235 [Melampsora larici-populina 98AG31]
MSARGPENPSKRVLYEEGGGNVFGDPEDESDEEDEVDDEELESGWNGGLFTEDNIKFFRNRMQDAVLPSGITRLPSNLGKSKHGKLKAAQWHSLFAYVIPLIVLEVFVTDVENIPVDSNRGKILLNISDLSEMDKTISRRFGQLQRLMADHPISVDTESLEEGVEIFKTKRNEIELKDNDYEALLALIRVTMPDARHHRELPHPPMARVLHSYATPQPSWKVSQYVSVSVLKPNNCIKYKEGGQVLDSSVFVSPTKVTAVAAYRLLPNDTWGIPEGGIILRPCDHKSVLEE